jgi:hypothetical protein
MAPPISIVNTNTVTARGFHVPERDVPFVDCGDPADVEVDALPGVVFKTRGSDKVEVSRLAASEDPQTRMMRTEVHGGAGAKGDAESLFEEAVANALRAKGFIVTPQVGVAAFFLDLAVSDPGKAATKPKAKRSAGITPFSSLT